jgi:hypothetical protein
LQKPEWRFARLKRILHHTEHDLPKARAHPDKSEPAITGPRSLRDPRSRESAIQTMRSLKRFLESMTFDAKHVEEELQLIVAHKHWEACGFENLMFQKPKLSS